MQGQMTFLFLQNLINPSTRPTPMKNLWFVSLLLLTTFFASCVKEEPSIEQNNSFSCNLILTIDSVAGFYDVMAPDSSLIALPKNYRVSGDCYWIGSLNGDSTTLKISNYYYDPLFHAYKSLGTLRYVDQNGDELIYYGDFYHFPDNYIQWYFYLDSGTGKWKDASGWNFAGGAQNPDTGNYLIYTTCGLTVF